MKTQVEQGLEGVVYISGVMDEETRPVLSAALDDLEEGEGMLVIFRLNEGEDSDHLLEFDIKDFSPSSEWDCVSDKPSSKPSSKPLQDTVSRLAAYVNEKRLPNIVFAQGGEKVKATDKHTACFGVIGGPRSGKITKIKKIVHQQLNMGLNGDLLLHESNLIMEALYRTDVIAKDAPLSFRSYGAGGSSSHKVHPGDILTSDAVLDIRTYVNPIFVIQYLEKYLSKMSHPLGNQHQFTRDIEDITTNIRQRFYSDLSYTGISIISDIEALINLVSRATERAPKEIMAGMKPEEKEYYGEISISNSSQGARVIKRITDSSFLGDAGQKRAKHQIVSFMNKMGEYEKIKPEITRIIKSLDKNKSRKSRADLQRAVILELKRRRSLQGGIGDEHMDLSEIARIKGYEKLSKKIEALEIELTHLVKKREELLFHAPELEFECRALRSEISKIRDIQHQINPRQPFVITASGNIFFNHAEKEAVSQFGVALVEMENHLFKQTINKAITEGCYVQSELVTKIAADPVCIPLEATASFNSWANRCAMTLDDYVSAYMWAFRGKKQDMKNIPPCGIWGPGTEIVSREYPCGLIRIDANPLEMEHTELRKLLGNTPSYIVYQDKFFYADEVMDVEDLGPATDETRQLIINLRIPYQEDTESHLSYSLFREIDASVQNEISQVTKHRHRATYERLFYSLSTPGAFYSSETEDDNSSSTSSTSSMGSPQILNPFWKEIGVDLLSEIANGKAFSGSIFSDANAEEKAKQTELRNRAKEVICSSSEVEIDIIRSLFRDYLGYMVSKMPLEQRDKRGISAEEDKYPVYARNAVYKTGYVSGPVDDWDAAIYKSNNSAVLVGIVDRFLSDAPISAIDSRAVIAYTKPPRKDKEVTEVPNVPVSRKESDEDLSAVSDAVPLTMQSLLSAIDSLLRLQNDDTLEPHHQEVLRELVDTLLEKWQKVSEEPADEDYKKSLAVFAAESKMAVDKAAKAFERNGLLFCLIRPILNSLLNFYNLIQRLIFKEPKPVTLFQRGPTAEALEKWRAMHGAMKKLWEKCLEPQTSVELQPLNLRTKSGL